MTGTKGDARTVGSLAFLADLHAVFWAANRDGARKALGTLQANWGARYPRALGLILRRFDEHVRFFDQPEPFWNLLRSTNLIERFNLELRRRLNAAGTMHSELEILKLMWAVSEAQESRWAKHPWKARQKFVQEPVMA